MPARMRSPPRIALDPQGQIPGYHIADPAKVRREVLDKHIKRVARKKKESRARAATRIKARLNVLRIYRKTRQVGQCRALTADMRHIDKAYLKPGARTGSICGSRSEKARRQHAPGTPLRP